MRLFNLHIFILIFISCKITDTNTLDDNEDFYLFQNNKKIESSNNTSLLYKEPFEIIFRVYPNNDNLYLVQLAAILNEKDFLEIDFNQKISDISYFSLGSGYAMFGDFSDDWLLFENHNNSMGHHYLFYEHDTLGRLSINNNFINNFSYVVNEFWIRNEIGFIDKQSLINSSLNKFYLVSIIDLNQNDTIDYGELQKLEVIFNQ